MLSECLWKTNARVFLSVTNSELTFPFPLNAVSRFKIDRQQNWAKFKAIAKIVQKYLWKKLGFSAIFYVKLKSSWRVWDHGFFKTIATFAEWKQSSPRPEQSWYLVADRENGLKRSQQKSFDLQFVKN